MSKPTAAERQAWRSEAQAQMASTDPRYMDPAIVVRLVDALDSLERLAVDLAQAPHRNWARLRADAQAEAERRGFTPSHTLHGKWYSPQCLADEQYDPGEVLAAIVHALTQEGISVWNGDGVSIVEQMVRVQWDARARAVRDVRVLRTALEGLKEGACWCAFTRSFRALRHTPACRMAHRVLAATVEYALAGPA